MKQVVDSRKKLLSEPVEKTLINMAGGMLWGFVSIMLFNFIDTFFLAKLGIDELAAITFTFPVVMIINGIGIGLGAGVTSVVSRQIGAEKYCTAKQSATSSLILGLIIISIVTILGIPTIEPVFKMLGASAEIMPKIQEYMFIWYLGAIFVYIPMIGNATIRATGDTISPSLIMGLGALVNLILDPILIFGLLGFPRLEMEGAAIATVFARGVSCALAIIILKYRKQLLDFKISAKEVIESWKEIVHIGIFSVFNNLLVPVSIGVITWIVALNGKHAVAALGIASRVEMIIFTVIMALAVSAGPFAAQNFMAKSYQRVKQAIQFCFKFSFIWHLLLSVALFVFAVPIAKLFTQQAEVVEIAKMYFRLVPFSYAFEGVVIVTASVFNALGKPLVSFWVTFFRSIIFYIPLALLLNHYFGVLGVFASVAVVNILVSIIAFYISKKQLLDKCA